MASENTRISKIKEGKKEKRTGKKEGRKGGQAYFGSQLEDVQSFMEIGT